MRRIAAVLATAALLCSALLINTSAAQATTTQPTSTQVAPHLVASHRATEPAAGASPAATFGFDVWYGTSNYQSSCPGGYVCIWTGTGFTGYGYFFWGPYGSCQGWRFEGTVLQDNTYSIWNRKAGGISIWNRHADGSYNYDKYGWLPSNYSWGTTPFSYIMDGWAYDPNNTCGNPPNFFVV
jgi:hypothetical protein